MACLRLRITFQIPIPEVAGSQNTAADFSLTLDLTHPKRPKEKVQLKLRNDILTSPIEVNLQSTDVADEEHLFSSYLMKMKNQNKKFCCENT